MRTYIHHTLQKPQVLHPGVSAVWTHRAFVGHSLAEVNARVLESIHPGKDLSPDHAAERFIARISAAIVDVPRDNRSNHAVSIQPNPGVAKSSFISMRARGHVLGARFHPLYRVSSGFLRSHRTDCHLRVAGDLDAKAATDIRGLHANAINVNIKMRREKLNGE